MKCPKNTKGCTAQSIARAKGKNFICSGIIAKPKVACDTIRLCVRGATTDKILGEMTPKEAQAICTVLACAAYNHE
jgi:hypothetical protein